MRIILFVIGLLYSLTGISQDQMYDICPLKVGEPMPDATLVNDANEPVNLSDLTTDKPTVIVFYRGAWCGYCTRHLAELNDIKEDVEALGFQMIGITVDQSAKLDESVSRSASEIPVFSDAKLEAIQAFGLDWQVDDELFEKYINKYQLDLEEWSGTDHRTLPVPAIFVVKDKRIEFQYVNPNYKIRLKPETLLAVLKTL